MTVRFDGGTTVGFDDEGGGTAVRLGAGSPEVAPVLVLAPTIDVVEGTSVFCFHSPSDFAFEQDFPPSTTTPPDLLPPGPEMPTGFKILDLENIFFCASTTASGIVTAVPVVGFAAVVAAAVALVDDKISSSLCRHCSRFLDILALRTAARL